MKFFLNSFGAHLRQYAIVFAANLSMVSVGISQVWSSPMLIKLSNETFPVLERAVTQDEAAWIISSVYIALLIGLPSFLLMSEKLGRKYCFCLACIPRLLGYLLIVFVKKYWCICLARFIIGIADTVTFNAVPMYSSEIASKEIRGALGIVSQISCSLGYLIVFSAGPYLDYITANSLITCIVLTSSIPLIFLPESPYYLYKKGQEEEALKNLTYLRDSSVIAAEELKEYRKERSGENVQIKQLLKSRNVLKSLVIVLYLGVAVQTSGQNLAITMVQPLLEATGSNISSNMSSLILGIIQLASCSLTILFIEKFRRKLILSIGFLVLAVGMTGLGVSYYMMAENKVTVGVLNYLPIISFIINITSYSGGISAINFSLISELFEGAARSLGLALNFFVGVMVLLILTLYFGPITNAIGMPLTFWLFAASNLVTCVFVCLFVPETKGKSFLEIQNAVSGFK